MRNVLYRQQTENVGMSDLMQVNYGTVNLLAEKEAEAEETV